MDQQPKASEQVAKVAAERGKFDCTICNAKLTNASNLSRHMKSMHALTVHRSTRRNAPDGPVHVEDPEYKDVDIQDVNTKKIVDAAKEEAAPFLEDLHDLDLDDWTAVANGTSFHNELNIFLTDKTDATEHVARPTEDVDGSNGTCVVSHQSVYFINAVQSKTQRLKRARLRLKALSKYLWQGLKSLRPRQMSFLKRRSITRPSRRSLPASWAADSVS